MSQKNMPLIQYIVSFVHSVILNQLASHAPPALHTLLKILKPVLCGVELGYDKAGILTDQ